jgi:hypothetical protein
MPSGMTTRRLFVACVVCLLGACLTFLNAWAGFDLGCDYPEKSGCRFATLNLYATYLLLLLALVAGLVLVARGFRAVRRKAGAASAVCR